MIGIGLTLALVAQQSGAGGPYKTDPNWAQYIQSCGSGRWSMRAVTVPTAGDSKAFKAEGIFAATGQNQLFRWGGQFMATASTDGLICEGMTTSATITAGTTCAEGCGYATFDGVAGTGRYGVMNCHYVEAGNYAFFKLSKDGWIPYENAGTTKNVTIRRGRCTAVGDLAAIGGGCRASSECGTGGTCDLTNPPDGVYMFWIPLTNGGVGRLETCVQ